MSDRVLAACRTEGSRVGYVARARGTCPLISILGDRRSQYTPVNFVVLELFLVAQSNTVLLKVLPLLCRKFGIFHSQRIPSWEDRRARAVFYRGLCPPNDFRREHVFKGFS